MHGETACKTSDFWPNGGQHYSRNRQLGPLDSRDRIDAAGYPTRCYVCGASQLLKDSNVGAPIGHGTTRLGGSTCRVHEVGKRPTVGVR